MARAYAYANGDGPLPNEIRIARLVERFGADSIYGRPLGAKEIINIELAEDVILLYEEKSKQANQAEWANNHPFENDLLMCALRCAVDLGYIHAK